MALVEISKVLQDLLAPNDSGSHLFCFVYIRNRVFVPIVVLDSCPSWFGKGCCSLLKSLGNGGKRGKCIASVPSFSGTPARTNRSRAAKKAAVRAFPVHVGVGVGCMYERGPRLESLLQESRWLHRSRPWRICRRAS